MRAFSIVITLWLCSLFSGLQNASAQAINEAVESSVYDFLYRNAQKGNIELDDIIRPLTRNQIAVYLDSIEKRAQRLPGSLNAIEKKELLFYWREYGDPIQEGLQNQRSERWLSKDPRGRLRFFSNIAADSVKPVGQNRKTNPFQFNIEPILQGEFQLAGDKERFIRRAAGLQLWVGLGKRWGVQAYYRDITEDGEGLDQTRQFTPANGLPLATTPNRTSLNFSDVRVAVNYQWNSGLITIGKEQFVYGYGVNGNIIHSTKAPTYPYIRFNQKVLPWLQFEYLHGVLHSGMIDTANSYRTVNLGVFGGQRFKMIPKYYVSHSLRMRIAKGLHVAVGESVVYSDKIQPGYWLPVMFFKAWDQYIAGNNINAGANTQLFVQVSSRHHIPYTHLYGSLFIDEIRPTVMLNPDKSRNQVAFTLGASVTDLPLLPYWTFNFDYTRLNPFVYQNLFPAQEYTNNGFLMGDWMGSNADRYLIEIKYTPIPRLRLSVRQERIRKGGPGTTEQQYFATPQPRFLNDMQFKQWTSTARAVYEWKNNIFLHLQFQRQDRFMYTGGFENILTDRLNAGFAIGL
jgi:hypothetical protein